MFRKEVLIIFLKFYILVLLYLFGVIGISYYLALVLDIRLFCIFLIIQFVYCNHTIKQIKNPKKYCTKDCNAYDDCKYFNCEEYDKKRWLI